MDIKVCTTDEWSEKEWNSYCKCFNTVFEKDLDLSYFKQKYATGVDDHAYHALLLNDDFDVVGSCTVIPFLYKRNAEIIKVGQAVDVFIHEAYRTDPLMLGRMYDKLKKLLIANNFISVLAVPNALVYQYWKNIVKWKDVGDLTYWMFPVRVGNIFKKWKFLNIFSFILSRIWLFYNKILMLIFNKKEKKCLYELLVDDTFTNYRYYEEHNKVVLGDTTFYYRIYDEDGVQTAYLIDAKQNEHLSYKALAKGVSYILRNTDADIILYVGAMKLFQSLFIKVPKKFEPKRLPLTCDILDKEKVDEYSDMLEIENWNFGLLNYDVR
jgi:hypothetical protein